MKPIGYMLSGLNKPLRDEPFIDSLGHDLQNLPFGIAWVDMDMHVLGSNDAFRTRYGMAVLPLVRRHIDELLSRKIRTDSNTGVEKLRCGDSWVKFRTSYSVAEGLDVVLAVHAKVVRDGQGNPLYTVIALKDVTDVEQLELQLRQVHKLEAVGRLASGIAHEINTPIQFIGDNISFLSEAFEGLGCLVQAWEDLVSPARESMTWAQRQEYMEQAFAESDVEYLMSELPTAIEQAAKGVDRVASIVSAMKAFGHPGNVESGLYDLNAAISDTVTVASNETRYVADVTTELGEIPLVRCRLGDINQVLLNLLVNAAHAINDKFSSTSERGTITVSSTLDGDAVVLAVTDNGCGMSPEVQAKIFDPFFTTKEIGKGTGQGMALARALVVDGHHGRIDVDSTPRAGTTISLRLPVEGSSSMPIEGMP